MSIGKMTIGRYKRKHSKQNVPHGDSSHLHNDVVMFARDPHFITFLVQIFLTFHIILLFVSLWPQYDIPKLPFFPFTSSIFLYSFLPSVSFKWLTFLLCLLKALISNLGPDAGYSNLGFRFFREMPRQKLKLDHDHFPPYSSQFAVH
jgi:hypothetical protein